MGFRGLGLIADGVLGLCNQVAAAFLYMSSPFASVCQVLGNFMQGSESILGGIDLYLIVPAKGPAKPRRNHDFHGGF